MNTQLNPQFQEDITSLIWFIIAVIFFCLLYLAARSADKAKETEIAEDSKQPNILDQIENESIYCGAPTANVVTSLYKAAKRARKDKALSREIRTELDKAINQYENSMSCQN